MGSSLPQNSSGKAPFRTLFRTRLGPDKREIKAECPGYIVSLNPSRGRCPTWVSWSDPWAPWPADCQCRLAPLAGAHFALTLAQAVTRVFSIDPWLGDHLFHERGHLPCLHLQPGAAYIPGRHVVMYKPWSPRKEKQNSVLLDEISDYLMLCMEKNLLQKTNNT